MAGLRKRESGSASKWVPVFGAAALVVLVAAGVGVLVLAPWSGSADSTVETTTQGGPSISGDYQGLTGVTAGSESDVQGAPQQLEGEPFRTCEVCHADFLEKPVQDVDHDLIFSHEVHLDRGFECVTCHEPPLGHFDTPAPMMVACLQCHDSETAPNDCANCHRKIDEIAPGLDEPVVHLDPNIFTRKSCEKCHDVKVWCEECHGVEMPHPAGWQKAHPVFAKSHADTCVKCHQSRDPNFCVTCHGVEMPHPAFWYSSHGDVAGANPKVCARCHPDSPRFCNQCHHAGFSPTAQWTTSQHGRVVKAGGTSTCFACHEQAFCERCHTKGTYVKS
ncbi:MAG: cytochrome c3 family protein [Thermoleophilia bacterium]